MDGKLVIVTGASRGIGKAIATKLVEDGYHVVAIARDTERLTNTIGELSSRGRITGFTLELCSRGAIKRFTERWQTRLYGIVNNAGIWKEERLDDPDRDIWNDIFQLNLDAPHFLTKGLLPHVQEGGRIVNISSQLGTSGRVAFGAYAASKHGLIGLTRCWAEELKPRITVNAICPGWVRTQSNIDEIHEFAAREGKTFEEKMEEIRRTTTRGRFIEPEEVADFVAFLLSEQGKGLNGGVYEIK